MLKKVPILLSILLIIIGLAFVGWWAWGAKQPQRLSAAECPDSPANNLPATSLSSPAKEEAATSVAQIELPKRFLAPADRIFDPDYPGHLRKLDEKAFESLGPIDRRMFGYINRKRQEKGLEKLDSFPTGMDGKELVQLMNGLQAEDKKPLLKEVPTGLRLPTEEELAKEREKIENRYSGLSLEL